MKFNIVVQIKDSQHWHDMVEWCWENVGLAERDWKIENHNPFTFGFKQKGDAVIFALKFV